MGDDVALAQNIINGIARIDFVGVAHPHFQAATGDKHAVGFDIGILQRLGDATLGFLIDNHRLAVGRNLDGGGDAVQVGQGVNGCHRQR